MSNKIHLLSSSELLLYSAFIIQCYILSVCGIPKNTHSLPVRNDALNKRNAERNQSRNKRGKIDMWQDGFVFQTISFVILA